MTTESARSPAIPPPQEQHSEYQPLPQNPVNSCPISAVTPSTPKVSMEVYVRTNGIVSDKLIDKIEEPSYYKYLDSKERADKFRRYEAEFKQYLMAKYFTGRDLNGVGMFEETIIDGETIMSSKWPCTRFYADPGDSHEEAVQCLVEEEEEEKEEEEEESVVDLAPVEISPGEISNGGTVSEKNSC